MMDNNRDDVSRRNVLRGMAAGAAVVGLGAVSGTGAAETDEAATVIGGEQLPEGDAQDYFDTAMGHEHVEALVEETGGGQLEPQFDEVTAFALETDDEDVNEHDPTAVGVPLDGEGGGRCVLLGVDGGEGAGGFGHTVTLEGDHYVGKTTSIQVNELTDGHTDEFGDVDEGDISAYKGADKYDVAWPVRYINDDVEFKVDGEWESYEGGTVRVGDSDDDSNKSFIGDNEGYEIALPVRVIDEVWEIKVDGEWVYLGG